VNNQVTSLCFFSRKAVAPQSRAALRAVRFTLWLLPLLPALHANQKGPLQPHKAAMCCPAFARSREDDKEKKVAWGNSSGRDEQ